MTSKEQRQFFNSDLSHNRELSNEDVTNQSRYLLNQFIFDRLQKDGLDDAPGLGDLQEPGTPTGPPMEHIREIGRALKCIGDDLDKDQHLNEVISRVKPDEERTVFLRVARGFFDDGIFTWGRVVALFYFAYKVCAKALNRIPLIRGIINLIVDFMRDNVVQWIKDRGGWERFCFTAYFDGIISGVELVYFLCPEETESIREYFGTTNTQLGLVFLSGAVVCAGLYLYKNWV